MIAILNPPLTMADVEAEILVSAVAGAIAEVTGGRG